MALKLTNNATSTLLGSINAAVTTLSVQTADAAKFPVLGAGDWFPITVVDASGNMEIMRVTARAVAVLTVVRAQESTIATAFNAGARVDVRLTTTATQSLETPTAIHDATAKAVPVAADEFGFWDSVSTAFRKLTLANLLAAVWSGFGVLIAGGSTKTAPADTDFLPLADSAASFATKKLAIAGLKAWVLGSAAALSAPEQVQGRSNIGAISQTDALAATRPSLSVNGSFQDSPENGFALGTASGYFFTEMFADYFTASGAAVSSQLIVARTLNANDRMGEFKVTTAKAVLGASDFRTMTHIIEGSDPKLKACAFGTTSAKQMLLHFEMTPKVAGLHHIRASNSAGNRVCVIPFTITAGQVGVPIEFGALNPRSGLDMPAIIIPPDFTGTWLDGDGTRGLVLDWVFAAGTSLTGGAANSWGTTTFLAASTQANNLATTGTYRIADVGVKADPDATGVYGSFRVGEKDAVFGPNRYLRPMIIASGAGVGVTGVAAILAHAGMAKLPTFQATGGLKVTDGFGGGGTLTQSSFAVTIQSGQSRDASFVSFGNFASLTQGRLYFTDPTGVQLFANARP